jgi:hypothetical protein
MDHIVPQDDETDDLLSALEVIEAQPLASRAGAYENLHDALARRLDAAPVHTAPRDDAPHP